MYFTLGSALPVFLVRVIKVSMVLVPRVVRPGIALGSSQNDTHDMATSKIEGMK